MFIFRNYWYYIKHKQMFGGMEMGNQFSLDYLLANDKYKMLEFLFDNTLVVVHNTLGGTVLNEILDSDVIVIKHIQPMFKEDSKVEVVYFEVDKESKLVVQSEEKKFILNKNNYHINQCIFLEPLLNQSKDTYVNSKMKNNDYYYISTDDYEKYLLNE